MIPQKGFANSPKTPLQDFEDNVEKWLESLESRREEEVGASKELCLDRIVKLAKLYVEKSIGPKEYVDPQDPWPIALAINGRISEQKKRAGIK